MKKLLSLAMATVMALSLVSCSSSSSDGAVPDTIKIGVMGTMTGEQALDGDNIKGAIAVIEQELEAAGGLQVGDKMVEIEFIYGDTEAKPEQAVNVIQKFIEQDQVVAIVGPNNSSDCLAAYEVSQAAGIPSITNCGTNTMVTEIGDYVFRACFIDSFQGSAMASYAYNTLGLETSAILYNNADAYSTGLMESFYESFEAIGGTIVACEAFAGTEVKDYSAQLTAIMAADPDAFFIPNQNNMIPMIVQQARAMGIDAQLLGCDSWDYDFLPELIGLDYAEGAVYTSGFSSGVETAADFVAAFSELNDFDAGFASAMTYEATWIILQAIQDCESVDGEALRDAMAAIEIDLPSGPLTFDEYRNPVKSCAIVEYQGSDRVYITSVDPS